ncbi:MAG: hypothetical protein IKK10_06225 [Clostridia bacterium]|nr:hypothetical protein [Clostridia bacterium]
MKKLIRLLSVIALIALLGMMFTGCDMLDELKARHAVLSEDRETVSFQGKTFVKLPEGVPYFFNDVYSNRISVTESDVPVLLSEELGYTGYYDGLREILAVSNIDIYKNGANTYKSLAYPPEEIQSTYYTQQENYEEYSQISYDDADRIGFQCTYYGDYGTALLSSKTSEEIFSYFNGADDGSDYAKIIEESREVIYPLYKCNKGLTLRGTLSGYELHIMQTRDIYLTNYLTATSVKLSDEAVEDILTKYYDFAV